MSAMLFFLHSVAPATSPCTLRRCWANYLTGMDFRPDRFDVGTSRA